MICISNHMAINCSWLLLLGLGPSRALFFDPGVDKDIQGSYKAQHPYTFCCHVITFENTTDKTISYRIASCP